MFCFFFLFVCFPLTTAGHRVTVGTALTKWTGSWLLLLVEGWPGWTSSILELSYSYLHGDYRILRLFVQNLLCWPVAAFELTVDIFLYLPLSQLWPGGIVFLGWLLSCSFKLCTSGTPWWLFFRFAILASRIYVDLLTNWLEFGGQCLWKWLLHFCNQRLRPLWP